MLLVRGAFVADQRDSVKFDEYELKSWPAGLDAPFLNVHNESEFLLFYSPSNSKTDELIQNAVNRMNNEYIKWYSMDEFFLDKTLYQPILQETDITTIETIINSQLPNYKLSAKQRAHFCCNDEISDYKSFNCGNCKNSTTTEQKEDWISENLIDNIKSFYWDPCTRQQLSSSMKQMIKGVTCASPLYIQSRTISEHSIPEHSSPFEARLFGIIARNVDKITEELIPNRNKRSFNYSTICSEPNWSSIADTVHATIPRVKVTPMPFNSFSEIENFMNTASNDEKTRRRLAAIDFHSTTPLDYSIRMSPTRMNRPPGYIEKFMDDYGTPQQGGDSGVNWRTAELKLPLQITIPRLESPACVGGPPHYFTEAFLTIQHAIDTTYTEIETGTDRTDNLKTVLKRYAFGKHAFDAFPTTFQVLGPFLMMLATLGLGIDVCKSIVLEKENRTKEYIKTMGGSSFIQWMSWWIYYLFIAFIISMVFTVLTTTIFPAKLAFKFYYPNLSGSGDKFDNQSMYDTAYDNQLPVLAKSHPVYIFLNVFININQMIWANFMLSSFLNKSSTAGGISGMVHFIGYFPYDLINLKFGQLSRQSKLLWCYFPALQSGESWYIISSFEGSGVGLNSENAGLTLSTLPDVSIYTLWIWSLLISFQYFIVCVYFEQIFPGEYGVAKKWWFPLDKDFWFPPKPDPLAEIPSFSQLGTISESTDAEIAINIKNLRKEFTTIAGTHVAVKNLNLEICKNQITSFLGHNGAGKTTTMNMLVGMYEPTNGTAYINGYDIRDSIDYIRKSIGLCPQFDILYPNMTVREHFAFFAALKGVPESDVNDEVESIIKQMDFSEYCDHFPTELSGGWRRRISVCIAMIGGSEILILDEPTSGMDPSTRRTLWNMLLEIKKTRTILLSTHFMDEADILGDRVCILSDGKVRAVGSPTFLKNQWGCGYHIVCSLEKPNANEVAPRILEKVKNYVQKAAIDTAIGQDVNILLPTHDSDKFPALLQHLESVKEEFQITSIGILLTNMDEVFLKCTKEAKKLSDSTLAVNSTDFVGLNMLKDKKKENFGLYLSQFTACIQKEWIITKSEPLVLLVLIFWGVLLIWGLILSSEIRSRINDPKHQPKLSFGPKAWNDQYNYGNQKVYNYGSPGTQYNANITAAVASMEHEWKEECGSQCAEFTKLEGNLDDTVLERFDSIKVSNFDQMYFEGTGLDTNNLYALFNGQHIHTVASSFMLMGNYFLKTVGGNEMQSIQTSNHPLPRNSTEMTSTTGAEIGAGSGNLYGQLLLFVITLIAGMFCNNKVQERVNKSKHIQELTGLPNAIYWGSAYIVDFLKGVFVIIVFTYFFTFTNDNIFGGGSSPNAWVYCALYNCLSLWATLPMAYIMSRWFITPASATVGIFLILYFIAIYISVIYTFTMAMGEQTSDQIASMESFRDNNIKMFPPYVLLDILNKHYSNNESLTLCTKNDIYESLCASLNITYSTDYLADDENGVGGQIKIQIVQGFCYFLLLLVLERWNLPALLKSLISSKTRNQVYEETRMSFQDPDVVKEENRIKDTENIENQDVLVTKNLAKKFVKTPPKFLCCLPIKWKCWGKKLEKSDTETTRVQAVDNISFGVQKQTIFGLLGVNGAGKSTTFGMLTGDLSITSGSCYVNGFDLRKEKSNAQQCVGYCPQFDALIDCMTGYETLQMFCKLRGLSPSDTKNSIRSLLKVLDLEKIANKPCGIYSGGNKRKLSAALAMVGEPQLLFLDEPSTGMDPSARHALWNSILAIQARGCSIILTSHSMEECEALCTKLAIMVNGKFECLGSVQHLRSKFGNGFSINFEFDDEDMKDRLQKIIGANYECKLLENHDRSLKYDFPNSNNELSIAELFEKFETLKKTGELRSYSIQQRTLEEIFLNFTKSQRYIE